jgi:hypothetical protein
VILLDENSLRSQQEFLEARRLPVRTVGVNWGRAGMSDEEILAELRAARQVTFFTRDATSTSEAFVTPLTAWWSSRLPPSKWPFMPRGSSGTAAFGRTRSEWRKLCGSSPAVSYTGHETAKWSCFEAWA